MHCWQWQKQNSERFSNPAMTPELCGFYAFSVYNTTHMHLHYAVFLPHPYHYFFNKLKEGLWWGYTSGVATGGMGGSRPTTSVQIAQICWKVFFTYRGYAMYVYCNIHCSPAKKHGSDPFFGGWRRHWGIHLYTHLSGSYTNGGILAYTHTHLFTYDYSTELDSAVHSTLHSWWLNRPWSSI